MKTLGWLLLCVAAVVAVVSFLHVGGTASAVGLSSPKTLATLIPGIILVAVIGIPGLLLVTLGNRKRR